jgi:hypothetical protein
MLSGLRRAEQDGQADRQIPGAAPGLADVGQLAATVTDAGVSVDVQWHGPRRQLPADIDASAFRIIQEAVTNVVRHAGTSNCQVIIEQRDRELAIEVIDGGRGGAPNGTGYGIAGMRERAALLHGDLSAGPRPGGGFRVAARWWLPGGRPAAGARTGPMTVRVVLADDQPLIRAGLRMLIADTPDLDVAGEAGTGAQAVQLARDASPTSWSWTSACPAWTASRPPGPSQLRARTPGS